MDDKKQQASRWFYALRDQICAGFEQLEETYNGPLKEKPKGCFDFKDWARPGGGGGTMGIMRGRVFEKVGVNVSTVHGTFPESFAKSVPGASDDPTFWASGISLVAHMHSPLVPAVHMNTRYIVTQKSWFGGGADLTPVVQNDHDTKIFHEAFQKACDQYDPTYYPRFKEECDQYFYLKHRQESRGVGGIFYDFFKFSKSKLKNFIVIGALIVIFVELFSNPSPKTFSTLNTLSLPREKAFQKDDPSLRFRIFSAKDAVDLIQEKPFFGHGLGFAQNRALALVPYPLVIHNTALWIGSEMGIITLIVLSILLIILLRNCLRKAEETKNPFFYSIFLIVLMSALFSCFHEILFQRILWFLMGFCALLKPSTKPTQDL